VPEDSPPIEPEVHSHCFQVLDQSSDRQVGSIACSHRSAAPARVHHNDRRKVLQRLAERSAGLADPLERVGCDYNRSRATDKRLDLATIHRDPLRRQQSHPDSRQETASRTDCGPDPAVQLDCRRRRSCMVDNSPTISLKHPGFRDCPGFWTTGSRWGSDMLGRREGLPEIRADDWAVA
jgi:hypothetical protein